MTKTKKSAAERVLDYLTSHPGEVASVILAECHVSNKDKVHLIKGLEDEGLIGWRPYMGYGGVTHYGWFITLKGLETINV